MGKETIYSEITGTVWKVLVSKGGTVSNESELIILESMKMEIPVESTTGGTVTDILVKEGDPVEEDQALVIIESD